MSQEKIWDYYQNEERDRFVHSVGRLKAIARHIAPGQRALNVGVGAGVFEAIAIARGIDVCAVDPNGRTIEELRHRLGLHANKAKVGFCQNIPFDDETFDAVVMSEVIEHLTADIAAEALGEVARVLKKGGILIGTVPARENLNAQMVVCPDCGHRFHRWGHVRSFGVQEVHALLSQYLTVEQAAEKYFPSWETMNWRGRTESLFLILLRSMGLKLSNENIFFIARKA